MIKHHGKFGTNNVKNDFSIFQGKRILVTGSTGFKGSWLCEWLLNIGAEVSGFALKPKPYALLFEQLDLQNRIDQHYGDIRDAETVLSVFNKTKPEVVIHLAAQALVRDSYKNPKETFDTNIAGGVNLLEAIRMSNDVRALVFITSDKCYYNKEWEWGYRENDELGGKDPYSASKAAAEIVFTAYQESYFRVRKDFAAATTRAGNVIGGGDWSKDRIVPDCIRSLISGDDIILRNPQSTRPWQHVLEPLSGYLSVAKALLDNAPGSASAWNFGPDPENVRPVRELAEKAIQIWGTGNLRDEIDPNALHEANLLMLANEKAKSILGWRARWNFDHAIEQTVLWYKKVNKGTSPIEVTRSQIKDYMQEMKT
ncbi:MAG: CDP-glucose 4,6-dehydratase [Methylocystaceae bacterium]|nr:CDP-glucose 4,6-dehydratase [Methylocystaceae bacterium]